VTNFLKSLKSGWGTLGEDEPSGKENRREQEPSKLKELGLKRSSAGKKSNQIAAWEKGGFEWGTRQRL